MNIIAKLSENGQLTLPPEVQKQLDLKAGDEIRFHTNENGEIVISSTVVKEIPKIQPVRELSKDSTPEEIQEYLDYKAILTGRYPDKQMLLVFSYSQGKQYKIRFVTATPDEFLKAEYFTISEKSYASRHVKKDAPKVYKLRWTNVKTKKNGQPSFLLKYGMQKEREILPEMDADEFLDGYANFLSKEDSSENETVGHYIEFLVLKAFGNDYSSNFRS